MGDDRADRRTDTHEDLAARVAALEAAVEELEAAPTRDTGRDRWPRPPTPREGLRFVHGFVLPATIAGLEAALRATELAERALRPVVGADGGGDRPQPPGRETLERLADALADLEASLAGGTLPTDPTARRLLEEVRSLRAEVRERATRRGSDEAAGAEGETSAGPSPDGDGPSADVEAELAAIKREVAGPDRRRDDAETDGSTRVEREEAAADGTATGNGGADGPGEDAGGS